MDSFTEDNWDEPGTVLGNDQEAELTPNTTEPAPELLDFEASVKGPIPEGLAPDAAASTTDSGAASYLPCKARS